MEIKHTIEILTKDIQDIEKLVRNLNNYPSPPQIEIDLALSRLRQVYDLLLLISRDAKNDRLTSDTSYNTAPSPAPGAGQVQHVDQEQQTGKPHHADHVQPADQPEAPAASQDTPQPQPADQQQNPNKHMDTGQQKTAGQQQDPAAAPQPAISRETPPPPQVSAEPDLPPAPAQPPVSAKNTQSAEAQSTPNQEKITASKKASILAEKFASDKSINERIAPGPGTDLSSKLTGEPIDSIKRNIGINDRFLIIRELLDGNNDAFNNLLQQLDTKQNFDEAYSVIQSSFPEQQDHEGVNLLTRLARRRYLSR